MISSFHWFLKITIIGLLSVAGLAWQTAPPQLDTLKVELWPEYDRAETLVIYKGQLTAETPLPAELIFLLPEHVAEVHAVAVEQQGKLFQIPPNEVKLNRGGQHGLLTFVVPDRNFQFEYYDPTILTKQGQTRQLTYRFAASFDISAVAIEVQQPAQATAFTIDPPARQTTHDVNNLTYHLVEVANLQLGSSFTLNATYQRSTDAPSVELLQVAPAAAPPPAAPTNNGFLEYSLVGLGAVMLVGLVGWWYYRRPQKISPSFTASFCPQCGVALRDQAAFCHQCGTPRR